MGLFRTSCEIPSLLNRKETTSWSSSCFLLLELKSQNFSASLEKLNDPPLQRKRLGFVPSNLTSPKHRPGQSGLKDISTTTHSPFSQINREEGISDKCHLLIFQRDKFWWCDQQVPRLFLACSTKIVTMATLGGQTSKAMHCEHRNSGALLSKKEEGTAGGFPMVEEGASPRRTPGLDPRLLCTWDSQAVHHPGTWASRRRGEMRVCGEQLAEWATARFFTGTKGVWRGDK